MSKLDPRIEAIRVKYELAASDFWELPQKKGTWICKHAALEIVAAKAGIEWAPPQILEAHGSDGVAAMVATGKLDGRTEWATGEATPKNNKNAYPWAMAEKRAKDRVVLKLSGIAGLVYSEDEADDFKEPAPQREAQPAQQAQQSAGVSADELSAFLNTIKAASTLDGLRGAFEAAKAVVTDEAQRVQLAAAKDARKAVLTAPASDFPGDNADNQKAA